MNSFEKKTGVLYEMRHIIMFKNMISLILEGAITTDELNDFSDELQNNIKTYLKN